MSKLFRDFFKKSKVEEASQEVKLDVTSTLTITLLDDNYFLVEAGGSPKTIQAFKGDVINIVFTNESYVDSEVL